MRRRCALRCLCGAGSCAAEQRDVLGGVYFELSMGTIDADGVNDTGNGDYSATPALKLIFSGDASCSQGFDVGAKIPLQPKLVLKFVDA